MSNSRIWLIDIRNEKGMTQQDVADKAGINRSFYTQIEIGTRTPSVDTAKRIAAVLEFDWTIFFEHNSGETQQCATIA